MNPGPNDRCPCGSKHKFKKCCGRAVTRSAGTFTPEDRQRALDRLHDLAAAPRFADEVEVAWEEFIDEYEAPLSEPGNEMLAMTSGDVYQGWLFFDRLLDDGRRLVDYALQALPGSASGERAFLEAAARSPMALYEVTSVQPGESMTLRDAMDGRQVTVRERSASREIRPRHFLAARIMPGTSGQPVIDQGCLPIDRQDIADLLDDLKTERNNPAVSAAERRETAVLSMHDAWLSPFSRPLPELVTSHGEAMLVTKVRFTVRDAQRAFEGLDSIESVFRDEGEHVWHWASAPDSDGSMTALGRISLEGEKLVLECMSAERGARGRALIEAAAGDALAHLATTHEHPAQMMASRGNAPPQKMSQLDPEVASQLKLEYLTSHYRRWIDEPVPALDGKTPREAAASPLRPRVIELVDGLEDMYRRGLARGEVEFDPSGMWAELGLDADPAAPPRPIHPPPTGAESMAALVPGLLEVAREVAGRIRRHPDFDAGTIVERAALEGDLAFLRFIRTEATKAAEAGLPPETAAAHGNLLGAHLAYLCNFEAHHRKTFWIAESLAWMLGQTQIDLTGDFVRPPFASLALVFTDRATLGIAERMLADDQVCELRGAVLRVATVYVTSASVEAGTPRSLQLAFTFDALDGRWPYLIVRDLLVHPDAKLDDVLDSRHADVDVKQLDPMFRSAALKSLVALTINALLYATSAGVEPEVRKAPVRTGAPGTPRKSAEVPFGERYTEDEVFYLPGTIDISRLRQLQTLERAPSGGELMHRFMVRGHWRRANPGWKDERPRWIRPYWKGPDLAAVVERAYRLMP